MRTQSTQISVAGLMAISLCLSGCLGGTHVGDRYHSGGEMGQVAKIESEAYLYDVKYFKNGKKNSFRLEIYLTDSLAGLAGRGYLGKGALKGWLTDDSIAVFFPTVNEHLYEPVSALLSRYECSNGPSDVNFLKLFSDRPDITSLSNGLVIDVDSSRSKRATYAIHDPACPWSLKLTYDLRKVGWRLKRFEFDDGRSTRLQGDRRKFRDRAKISQNRYRLDIPVESGRITL